ncbi:MAG TPA: hypothetical protein ENO39_05570 [Fervidicoccus fontis]|uniref:Lon proteolytic domain-containing protein n=1 Tax=Fervidicoccus fontis TaxID=683846 RepID=A0A2J6N2I5_9CREN|nr:MAG: hypothetical protein C0188_02700 [Fervidicoccus fontis]HEW64502.1 hypothetical protein [Fervidicoccus fontis]
MNFFEKAFGIVILLFISLNSSILIPNASSIETFNYNYLTKVSLPALAVTSSNTGVVTNLTVTVAYPGTGEVYFSADPATEIDTQSAARIAVLVATSILEIDYKKYDYFISIKSPSYIVGGPSAGAIMTIGIISALLNLTPNTNVAMTGMINPDGTIGPVGGIPEKLQAAAEAGYKIFLIPVGQEIVTEEKTVEQSTPFGTIIRYVPQQINVTELGEKLGVKVIEVSTIQQAMTYFFNNVTLQPGYFGFNLTFPPEVVQYFYNWKAQLEQIYNITMKQVTDLLKSGVYSSNLISYVNQYINTSTSLYSNAQILWSNKQYYSALSNIYQSDIILDGLYIILTTSTNQTNIFTYITQINQTYNSLLSEIKKVNITTITGMEGYIASLDRLNTANQSLNAAASSVVSYYNPSQMTYVYTLQDPFDLAIANMSVISARNWLSLSNVSSEPITSSTLYYVADYYTQYAKSVYTYYQSLANDVGVSTDLDLISNECNNALNYFYSGDYPAAIYYSIEVIATSTKDIHMIFDTDMLEYIIAEINNAANILNNSSYKSLISIAYLQQVQNLLSQYNQTKDSSYLTSAISLAVESSIYASLFSMLSGINMSNITIQTQPQTLSTTGSQTSSSTMSTTMIPNAYIILIIVIVIIVFVIAGAYALNKKKEKEPSSTQ